MTRRTFPSLPLVAVAATAASKAARTRLSDNEMCSTDTTAGAGGGDLDLARRRGLDGGGTRRTSQPITYVHTSEFPAVVAKPARTRDVRAAVCALVLRLTTKLLDPGAGVESKDPYVVHVRKDIARGKSTAVQQITAIAYDDVMHKGRSASEAIAWAAELIEEARAWEAERDGTKILPPDVAPVLRVENREECGENGAALELSANPTSIEAHERYIAEAQEEVDAQVAAISVVRQRMVLLRKDA